MPRLARLLAAAAIVLVALAAPAAAPAHRLVKAFWGPAERNGASQFPVYRDLGVHIYQTSLTWREAAPTRPAHARDPGDAAYRWPASLDQAIAGARKYHMRVLVQLATAPGWANGGRSREYAPNRARDFADFAYAASRRYPYVHLWMVWGEPTRRKNFQPLHGQSDHAKVRLTRRQAEAPRRYAKILDATYGALKRSSKRNQVIGGDSYTAGDIRPLPWVRYLRLPNGRPPRLDMYGHNPFSPRRPDLSDPPSRHGLKDFSDLKRFGKSVDRHWHRHVPFFLSEYTLATEPRDSEFNFYVTRKMQASWIKSAFRVARRVHAYALGWIHLYDDPPSPSGAPVSHAGLFDHRGNRKPGYYAFRGA